MTRGVDITHNIVSVSGGKDSTALLLLAIERRTENLQAVFADTGHEHAQTYEYVQYLNDKVFPIRTVRADFSEQIARKREYVREKWPQKSVPPEKVEQALQALTPTGNPFLDLCLWKGRFPSPKARFCSEELKRNPIIEQVQMPILERGETVWSWQGVRADESASRANLPELEDVGGGLWNYRPILRWTAQDCFDMHRKHGVNHNPLYEQGMGRVGCMPCIHVRKDELLEISRRFPDEIARVERWESIVRSASKRGTATLLDSGVKGLSNEEAEKASNILEMVEWSKTSRGRRQFDFFRVQDDGPTCSSQYGLCE
jgi:3'-phosphoadenosine 5'-phosphosulfate sulfotransferase (PAPS reductase)/FAD synthetase